jgi:hypothetical protein
VNPVLRLVLRILGIGALVAGGLAVALAALAAAILLGPLLFWIAWNVLDFGQALGLPELGFWGIVLATLFLVVGWLGKVVITGIVFLIDPSWFHGSAWCSGPSQPFATSSPSCCSPCSRRDPMRTRTIAADATRADLRSARGLPEASRTDALVVVP